MLDIIDHLTDILIGVAILFLVPLIYIGLKQDALIRTVVSEQTEQFIDETRSLGYLSRDMFEDFQQSLSKTGMIYDIKLEHKQKILEPEYRFRTLDEVLEEQKKAFTGSNVYHYYPISTNIPVVTDPIDNSGLTMNTETNESVLANANSTPSSGHTHTSACYVDHTHTASCQIVGVNHTSKRVRASRTDRGADGIYGTVSFQCYSCYETFYSIYYQYNWWKSGIFQIGNGYKIENTTTGAGGLTNASYYYNYSLSDPRVSSLMSQIDAIISVYAPYHDQMVVDLPTTNLLYVDASQNYLQAPFTGCTVCGDITGPAVNISVSSSTSPPYIGLYSSYQTMYHAGTSHMIGELRYGQGAGDNIYHWAVDGISFTQRYLRKDGTISQKNGKYCSRFLSVSGTEPRPGPEWTKIYTEYTIDGYSYVANEWRKPNPEWSTYLTKYYQGDFSFFGYDPKYSCPQCLKDGALPKTNEITYTCGLKETHQHTDSCKYIVPLYPGALTIQRYDSGWNTHYQYYLYMFSADQKYLVDITKAQYSAYEKVIRLYVKNNGIPVYDRTINITDPLYASWNATHAEIWNYLSSAYGAPTPYQYTTNYNVYGGALPTLKFLTCYKKEYSVVSCHQKIAGIAPTHPVQSVYTNEPLITTVRATYLDGSTKVVLANTSFSTATPVINRTVTLTYTDSHGTAKTCTITVNVIPRNKTCIHGHTYNLSNDGSDPGCPFCKAWLASLSIEFPVTSTFTIYKGTTLSENGVTLLATYLDGHTELVEWEYLDNLDRYYVGSQYVTISYKGYYVYLTVVTKRNLRLCSVCHRQYELHPDDTDPGCPWCAAETPIFTGNVMQYYNKRYTGEIVKELYEGTGIYRFTDEDYLTISVKNRKGSVGTKLLSAIYLNNEINTIHVIKAGYIREDGFCYK